MLRAQNISYAYDKRFEALKNVSCDFADGTLTGVIGPNGSGKSTLLHVLSGQVKPLSGHALLDNADVRALKRRETARRLAVVPQSARMDFDFSVRDVILMGRYAHISRFQGETRADVDAALHAAESTGVTPLLDRRVTALSGGEWQRVLIARALCQQTQTLLLDEPVSSLDIAYQLDILRLLRRLAHENGLCVVCVLHALELAANYCDQLLVLKNGARVAFGAPGDVLTPALLREVYGIRADMTRADGRFSLLPEY